MNFFCLKKKDPWVLWKVALAIGAGMAATMTIFASAFNSDNFQVFKPNAHVCVCVFDSTYYKITIINYISKTSIYTTFHMYSLGP